MVSVGERDISIPHGTIIGIVSLAVVLHKLTLAEVIFLEDTVLASTFWDSLETLEVDL